MLSRPRELPARRSPPPDPIPLHAGDRVAGLRVAVVGPVGSLEGLTTMDTQTTVRTFLDLFRDRGHRLLSDVSLVPPPGDPVLFTTSGMHPLTPHLLGRPHPLGRRLTSRQRCLRTTDLEEV